MAAGPSPQRIYHIAVRSDWEAAADAYRAPSLDTEGFIHCSDAEQLVGVANDLFRGREDLVLLAIDPARVKSPIRYEPAPDRPGLFPHVYGGIEVDAVVEAADLRPASDGGFEASLGDLTRRK
jgi:uncharacterized protein (DUF952 family)